MGSELLARSMKGKAGIGMVEGPRYKYTGNEVFRRFSN